MDLVHDVDPFFDGGRGVDRLIPQGSDLVYAVVGGGVQLQYIQNGAILNAQAGGALVAGVTVLRVFTVDRPSQNLGAGCLAGASGASEQIGVGQPATCHLLAQSLGDVGLAYHILKGAGPPLSV